MSFLNITFCLYPITTCWSGIRISKRLFWGAPLVTKHRYECDVWGISTYIFVACMRCRNAAIHIGLALFPSDYSPVYISICSCQLSKYSALVLRNTDTTPPYLVTGCTIGLKLFSLNSVVKYLLSYLISLRYPCPFHHVISYLWSDILTICYDNSQTLKCHYCSIRTSWSS